MRWGKAGSRGARRPIRAVAMFVLCSLYLGKSGRECCRVATKTLSPSLEPLATLSSPCKTLLPQREQTGRRTGLGTLGVKLLQSHPSDFKL